MKGGKRRNEIIDSSQTGKTHLNFEFFGQFYRTQHDIRNIFPSRQISTRGAHAAFIPPTDIAEYKPHREWRASVRIRDVAKRARRRPMATATCQSPQALSSNLQPHVRDIRSLFSWAKSPLSWPLIRSHHSRQLVFFIYHVEIWFSRSGDACV